MHPENFGTPAFQKHPNGAERAAAVVAVAQDPARHRDFLLGFSGASASRDTRDGFVIELPYRQAIKVVTPDSFKRRFGLAPADCARGLRLASIRFSAPDAAARQQVAMGAVLLFEPSR